MRPYPKHELSPLWTAIISAVATLVANGIWRTNFHREPLLLIAGFFGWGLTLAVGVGILTFVIDRCKDHLWLCAVVILSVLGVSVAVYGRPGMWSLIICGIVTAVMGRDAHRDAQDSEELEELGSAVKEFPPKGLLDSFSNPLWKRLELTGHHPTWVVRGERRGYEWLVIELLEDNTNGFDVTTTVFMVRLPRKSSRWHLPGSLITKTRQVCVDDEWVYVAEFGQRQHTRVWGHWLDVAIEKADEVVRTASTHPVPNRHYRMEDGTLAPHSHPSWNPHDASLVVAWASICLLVGGAVLLLLVLGYQEWQQFGTITRGCDPYTRMGTVLSGWKVVPWFGIVGLPLLGIGRMVHTLFTRVRKPGFARQVKVEGIILLVVTVGLALALVALEQSGHTAC